MRILLGAVAAAAAFLCVLAEAQAHAVCGDRIFPATLMIDDPGVGDEFSFPTIQYAPIPSSAGGGSTTTYGYEWDKTITQNIGFSISSDYQTQKSGGATAYGWDNLDVGLKGQVFCDEGDEFMASVGVDREFANTGSKQVTAGSTSTTSPTLFVGKGLGDILPGYLRPLATTYEVGYAISDRPSQQPNEWDYGFSVQYSLPYLQQHVKDLGLGPAGNLIPLVEFNFSSPTGQQTTGLASPGIFYEADTWQLGIEANIPINAATRASQGVGFIAQFHLFLDDIFPTSLGKPLFGGKS